MTKVWRALRTGRYIALTMTPKSLTRRMRWKRCLPLAAFLALAAASAAASASTVPAAIPFECPSLLPPTQQQLLDVPSGFEASVDSPFPKHELAAFRLNLGPLTEPLGAIYDDVKKQRDAKGGVTETLTWQTADLQEAIAICSYRATAVVLVRRLQGYRQCTATIRQEPGGLAKIKAARCE